MSSNSLNYGTYNDPLSMRLPQIMCGSCGSRSLNVYTSKTKKLLKENPGMTIQEAYDKNKIRNCCRAAIGSDFVLPDVSHNPLAIEGKIDIEHMTREEIEDAASKYIGNMHISDNIQVKRREVSTYISAGVRYPVYEYLAEDKEGEIIASFTPPFKDNRQPVVTKWLEVPISGALAHLTVDDDEKSGMTRPFVLVPKIVGHYNLKEYR